MASTKAPKGYHKLQTPTKTPTKSKQFLNLFKGSGLIIIVVGLSNVATFMTAMIPLDTISQIK